MDNYIILIEDDPPQLEQNKKVLEKAFPELKVETLETESDFYGAVEGMTEKKKPRAVLCDVMLPWSFPAPDAPQAPKTVMSEGFRKAGVRCWKLFRSKSCLREVPWIYFTILDELTIEYAQNRDAHTRYIKKTKDIEPLLREVATFLCLKCCWSPKKNGGEGQLGASMIDIRMALCQVRHLILELGNGRAQV